MQNIFNKTNLFLFTIFAVHFSAVPNFVSSLTGVGLLLIIIIGFQDIFIKHKRFLLTAVTKERLFYF